MLELRCGVCQKPIIRVFHRLDDGSIVPEYKVDCSCNAKSLVYHRVNRQPIKDHAVSE